MKLTRINIDGSMNDIDISAINKKNITSKLKKASTSNGDHNIKELYKWSLENNQELLCYGWYDGQSGFENKHDLPPNGISDFLDDDLDSSAKLLFGDIFITRWCIKSKKYISTTVSDYANHYDELFEGFDDCLSSDEDNSSSSGESNQSIDNDFINDDSLSDTCEDNDDYIDNDQELNIDNNIYETESDSNSEIEIHYSEED